MGFAKSALTLAVILAALGAAPAPASAAGDAQAEQLWQQADALMQRNQYPAALPLLQQAAGLGHARAQTTLGNIFHGAKGVPKDDTKAMFWYAKGAAQGHRFAQYSLANGYMLGLGGLPVDQVQATVLFEASAQQGLVDAQEAIAMSYELGRGTPHNRPRALAWLDQANRQGDFFAGGMAKILRNPNTPVFANGDALQNFITAVFSYCWRDRFPHRRPDLDSPGYHVWEHFAPNYRDTYCN